MLKSVKNTRKKIARHGLEELLRAIPDESHLPKSHGTTFEQAAGVVADALSRLTAPQIEALERVVRDCLHASLKEYS